MKTLTRISGTTAIALIASAAFAEDPDLLIFDWAGFEEDAYWAGYAQQHGVGPTYAFFGDEDEAFLKLRSGFEADVAHPCPHSVKKWRAGGLLEPWDLSKIPNYQFVADEFKTASILTEGDDVYFIPADNGATAIAWNTQEVPAEDVASLSVFNNAKYAQRMAIADNPDDAYALAFLATGTTDWTTASVEDFERASAWLREAHQLVRTYWTDGAELAQLMATGEVLVAWSWNETPVQMSAEGQPIAFNRTPAEGSSMWFCGYVNLANGPGDEDKAHDFINAFLAPDVTEYIVNEWGYGHSNTVAMADIGEETLVEVGLGPVDVPILQQLPMDVSLREMMVSEFEKIKAGF